MKLFMLEQKKFKPVTVEERDNIRSLAGKLIDNPNSAELFNNLHRYCLQFLTEKGIESGFCRKVKRYQSTNQDIDFWVDLQYRRRILLESLMISYNESTSISNQLHLMRKRELTGPIDTKKSFEEQFQFVHPYALRIKGRNKKYRIIKY